MTLEELRNAVEDGNDFYFMYNGVRAGVEATVVDSVPTYDVWYGDDEAQYGDFDELVNVPFFGGPSIAELLIDGAIEIEFV